MATQGTFNKEQSLKDWTELNRIISVGAYDECDHEGNYTEDGIEESIDNLETLGAQNGFVFHWHQDEKRWSLEPLSKDEKVAYQAAWSVRKKTMSLFLTWLQSSITIWKRVISVCCQKKTMKSNHKIPHAKG